MTIEQQIKEYENRLLKAMEDHDVEVLDELLHDQLIFNIPTGQTVTKQMDIENFRSGKLQIASLTPSNQLVNVIEDTVAVSVTIALTGSFANTPIEGNFRYLRVWKKFDFHWKVIAGSGYQV